MTGLPGSGRGRLLAAGAVVAGLAVVYGAGYVSHPAPIGSGVQLARATGVPVVSAVRACPAPGSAGVTAASVATAAVPATSGPGTARPAAPGQAAAGQGASGQAAADTLVISRLSGTGGVAAGPVLHTLAKPGVLGWSTVRTAPAPKVKKIKKTTKPKASGTGGTGGSGSSGTGAGGGTGGTGGGTGGTAPDVATLPGRGGVQVQAAGAMAQGLEVEQTGPGGLVTAPCPAPGTDFWFAGPGPDAVAGIQLYLMNTDSDPADVEVDAVTDSGPLVGSTDTGIVVPPHGLVTQSLGKLLHNSRVIGLHVSTSVGRVAAAVRETKSASQPGGWLTPLQPPSRHLVIPGLPRSAGARDLFIIVPGSNSAQLKITAVTAKGSYQPTGGNGIDLAGDSVVTVKLPSLSEVAAAIKITASVPVVAAVAVPGGASGAPGAFSGAAAPVREQGIAAANPAGAAGSADLVLSAPGAAASVRIATATSKIAVDGGRVVHIAAGHTVVTPIKPPAGGKTATFAVVLTPLPGSGPLYAGRFIAAGGVIRSILPVTSALTWVPLTATRDSLDAVRPAP